MSVLVFYKEQSEHARAVDDYLHDFERRTSHVLETVDPDSVRGTQLCELYDIVEYPTIVATNEDGQMRNSWRGIPLPTIDEVSYYV
jgi:hypothetical protein